MLVQSTTVNDSGKFRIKISSRLFLINYSLCRVRFSRIVYNSAIHKIGIVACGLRILAHPPAYCPPRRHLSGTKDNP